MPSIDLNTMTLAELKQRQRDVQRAIKESAERKKQ